MRLDQVRAEVRAIVEWGYTSFWHKHKMRGLLSEVQDHYCAICGKNIGSWPRNIDHVWPRADGGYNGPGNMVVTHEWCNTQKQDGLPTGCEIIWLVAVCARLDVPVRLKQ